MRIPIQYTVYTIQCAVQHTLLYHTQAHAQNQLPNCKIYLCTSIYLVDEVLKYVSSAIAIQRITIALENKKKNKGRNTDSMRVTLA